MTKNDWTLPQKPLFMLRICINKRLNQHRSPSCGGRGSHELADLLERKLLELRLPVELVRGPCMNNCMKGPNLKIQGGSFFSLNGDISDSRVEEIITELQKESTKRRKNEK